MHLPQRNGMDNKRMRREVIFIMVLIFLFLLSLVSASSTIEPNKFNKWNYYSEGNESILYDALSLTTSEVCIVPKNVDLEEIVVEEDDLTKPLKEDLGKEDKNYEKKNVTYSYPDQINLYSGKNHDVLLLTKNVKKDKKEKKDDTICFPLNPVANLIYKLGEESITISSESGYGSTDVNVTQENGFAHLTTDPSLVLYMPFDVNTSTYTYDYSSNGNDGTFTGNSHYVSDGLIGGAFNFDGDDEEIVVGTNIGIIDSAGTVSLWFERLEDSTTSTYRYLFSHRDGTENNRIYIDVRGSDEKLCWGFGDNYCFTATSSTIIQDGWHNVVLTWNTTGAYAYFDGAYIGSYAYDIPTTDGLAVIGNSYSVASAYVFNGSIDEVMILNRTLSYVEIQQIYNSTFSKFYPEGEMIFENNNFETDNYVNVSIPNCQQLNGSSIQIKVNDGDYVTLNSTCAYNNYAMSGDVANANVTIKLNSGGDYFYSPAVVGNISLESWTVSGGEEVLSCASYNPSTGESYVPAGCVCYCTGEVFDGNITKCSCYTG